MLFYSSSSTQNQFRIYSILGDRAIEADFISGIVLFLIAAYLLYKQNILEKITFPTSIFIGSTYLLILKSRTGLLSVFIGVTFLILLIIYLIWNNEKKKYNNTSKHLSKNSDFESGSIIKNDDDNYLTPMYKVIIVFVVISVSVIFSNNIGFKIQEDRPILSKTISSIFDNDFQSNKIRIKFWDASIHIFLDNPIYGIGLGKWSGTFPKYVGNIFNDENIDINSSIYAHNDYLELLAELGILGFLYTIFILKGVYRLLIKSLKDTYYIPYLIVAIGFSITSFFNFTKENVSAMSLFMIALGVGYSSNYHLSIINYEFFKRNKIFLKKFILIIGILLLSIGIWLKIMNYLNEREYLDAMKLKAQGKYVDMLDKLNDVSNLYYPVDMNKMPVDYYRGVGYFELKQYDKALEKFRNAREYMKFYPSIMNNEASALYMTGNYKESLEKYLEIKRMFPNYIEPQINLLSFYTNQKRYAEAKNLITELDTKSFNLKYVKNYSVFLKIKDYFKTTLQ